MTCTSCRIPVHTQFATRELVGAIVEGGLDPAEDPGWADSGAASAAEYARWAGHLGGMACLRMALGPGAPSLFALRDGAVEYGPYTEDADGEIRGLVYAPSPRTCAKRTVSPRPSTVISIRPGSSARWTGDGR